MDVAGIDPHVLDVDAPDQPTERPNLRRGIEPLVSERVGEIDIARDAAALKAKALQLLAELQADIEQS